MDYLHASIYECAVLRDGSHDHLDVRFFLCLLRHLAPGRLRLLKIEHDIEVRDILGA